LLLCIIVKNKNKHPLSGKIQKKMLPFPLKYNISSINASPFLPQSFNFKIKLYKKTNPIMPINKKVTFKIKKAS
jgi:hypothetical protein